jgi:hypothetical protein
MLAPRRKVLAIPGKRAWPATACLAGRQVLRPPHRGDHATLIDRGGDVSWHLLGPRRLEVQQGGHRPQVRSGWLVVRRPHIH